MVRLVAHGRCFEAKFRPPIPLNSAFGPSPFRFKKFFGSGNRIPDSYSQYPRYRFLPPLTFRKSLVTYGSPQVFINLIG